MYQIFIMTPAIKVFLSPASQAPRFPHRGKPTSPATPFLMECYEAARNGIAEINEKFLESSDKREKIIRFLDNMKYHDKQLPEYVDAEICLRTVFSLYYDFYYDGSIAICYNIKSWRYTVECLEI